MDDEERLILSAHFESILDEFLFAVKLMLLSILFRMDEFEKKSWSKESGIGILFHDELDFTLGQIERFMIRMVGAYLV